jgi:hypothetical protein
VMKEIIETDPLNVTSNRKRTFRNYSNRFSQTIPAAEAVYAGVGASDQERRDYLNAISLQQMAVIERSLTGQRAMIRRLLELELQARSDRQWTSGHKSGRLQSVRLVQAIQGRETVYQKREDGKDMDTLLFISIDGSQSMSGPGMEDAVALSFALSEALERTGCDIIVSAWGNKPVTTSQYAGARYSKSDLANFTAESGMDRHGRMPTSSSDFTTAGLLTRAMVKTKRQRTTDPTARLAFGLLLQTLNCSTPTYDAVFADLKDLSKESHAKKIYLHITDGEPNEFQNHNFQGVELMKEAHEYAAGAKVHMIGVGIGGVRVHHLFPDSIEVRGSDAYGPVIRKLAKLVAQEAGHAAHFKRAS